MMCEICGNAANGIDDGIYSCFDCRLPGQTPTNPTNEQQAIDIINASDIEQDVKDILIKDVKTDGLTDFIVEQIQNYCTNPTPDWVTDFSERYGSFEFAPQINKTGYDNLHDYIQALLTTRTEEIINDIPFPKWTYDSIGNLLEIDTEKLKQQLRDKWLSAPSLTSERGGE